jgi:hypothetical protein
MTRPEFCGIGRRKQSGLRIPLPLAVLVAPWFPPQGARRLKLREFVDVLKEADARL